MIIRFGEYETYCVEEEQVMKSVDNQFIVQFDHRSATDLVMKMGHERFHRVFTLSLIHI